MAKPLTLLTHHMAMFEWTLAHYTAFMMLKEAIIQAPSICYPDPARSIHRCIRHVEHNYHRNMIEPNFQ